MTLASTIPLLLIQLIFLALYIVGVIRSQGVARILLAVWVGVSAVSMAMSTILIGPIIESLSASAYGLLIGIVNALGSVLLAVALIIGRPGYRGEADVPAPAWTQPYPPR